MTPADALKTYLMPSEAQRFSMPPETLTRLAEGLEQARSYHLALTGFRSEGTFKAVREEVQRMDKALRKIADRRGTQTAAVKSLLAGLESARRYCPGVFMELDATCDLQLTMPVDIDVSAFERCVTRIENADSDQRPALAAELALVTGEFIRELKDPGPGGARRQARQFIDGLHELMRQFRDAMPEHALSSDPNTLFYRYACCWLEAYMHANIENPERHIENALREFVG